MKAKTEMVAKLIIEGLSSNENESDSMKHEREIENIESQLNENEMKMKKGRKRNQANQLFESTKWQVGASCGLKDASGGR